jgi:hypothetical protein
VFRHHSWNLIAALSNGIRPQAKPFLGNGLHFAQVGVTRQAESRRLAQMLGDKE